MADERVVSDLVTKFFLNTCRLRPQLSRCAIQATAWCGSIADRHPDDEAEADLFPLITGSVAEFYIEPMLAHVGDIDVMFHLSTELAIPRGYPPPTQLPAEFSDYVQVFEIVDSHLPGYVYLELRYLLTEYIAGEKYNYTVYDSGLYMSHGSPVTDEIHSIHGPALCKDMRHDQRLSADVEPALLTDVYKLVLPVDAVHCVRCLSWPPQAADWRTRHRNYGWPDSATVDLVVNNGCDVVGVAHRQCRQHEWMGEHQFRLSFSRAEIVLINSWMPIQQIVYHMLRFFVKTEGLADTYRPTFESNNYHIKTLMLWACELKSSNFWTNDQNLIRICVELLHALSVWLNHARCQHYFINDCNLIDKTFGVEITGSQFSMDIAVQLQSIDEAWLSTWFVHNYIRQCSMLCADNVSSLFRDVSTKCKLQNAISAVIKWRLNSTLEDMWDMLNFVEIGISSMSNISLTVRSCCWWMTELTKSDSPLPVYFTAVAFLHVAYKLSSLGFTDELMDVLATITGHFSSTCRHLSQRSSELSLSKATKLMKVVANSSRSIMQLIEIELSKAYLYRALRCNASDSQSIYCLVNIYLAVLCYTSGQYQTAIDHCTLVTRSQDHSQCGSHVVQGELLPKIDDDLDTVLGLAVFYQYVRTTALNQGQTQHVSVFATEYFVHYLNIRCLSVTQTSSTDDVYRLRNYICNKQLFIADVLLVKSVIDNIHCRPTTVHSSQQPTLSATDLNTSELVELLQRSAVEHLTTYRQLEARDFGSVAAIVTTDFEALYAYKHGDYQRCLQLSRPTQNVHTLLCAVHMPDIETFPEFIQLLDDDIVSLTALTLIVNPECRRDPGNVDITQLTLSLYLMTQCQLKLRHSVTSWFQTLDYTDVALRRYPPDSTLNRLTLALMKRKVMSYVKMMTVF